MIEEKDYDVSVTITFTTNVGFAPIERDGPVTKDDALANFYGYGLSELFASGEYGHTIDRVAVLEDGESVYVPQQSNDENAVRLACPSCGSDTLCTLENASCVAECDGIFADGPAWTGNTDYERGEQVTVGVWCDACDWSSKDVRWIDKLVPYVEVEDEDEDEQMWTVDSALWEVRHGEEDTPRTVGATEWLRERATTAGSEVTS